MAQKPTYDKVDPISGSFRARLAADLTLTDGSIGPVGVSLNTSGRVVVGTAGASGLAGLLIKNTVRQPVGQYGTPPGAVGLSFIGAKAGEAVDIMTSGEIVGLDSAVFTPGSKVYVNTAGVLSNTAPTGKFLVGFMADKGRLIVRIPLGAAALP